MALTITHLNTDASFLLTFEPLVPVSAPGREFWPQPAPFHILLDPWITGPSKILHSKISLTRHKEPACISSLRELPEPDLVIISQSKSDHCNEATLRQIPPGAKTVVLAEPAAAKVIRGWKHFDRSNVRSLKRWEDARGGGGGGSTGGGGAAGQADAVTRIPLPPVVPGGEPGEITVAYIPQRRDLTGLHAAVGITFRPPPVFSSSQSSVPIRRPGASATQITVPPRAPPPPPPPPPPCGFPTPPATPKSSKSYSNLPTIYAGQAYVYPPLRLTNGGGGGATKTFQASANDAGHTPTSTPTSPTPTLRSVRSALTLTPTTTHSNLTLTPTLTNASTLAPSIRSRVDPSPSSSQRPLSLLFSPHGLPFAGNLSSYATTHLVNEAALPLTALLHCFDSVSNPWWLGGHVLLGAPAGREIAVRLGARVWVSCHDGAKEVRGLATGWLRTRRWEREVVQRGVCEEEQEDVGEREGMLEKRDKWMALARPATSGPGITPDAPRRTRSGFSSNGKGAMKVTQVLDLASGEEVVLTSDGVWNVDEGLLPCKSYPGEAEPLSDVESNRGAGFHGLDKLMASVPEKKDILSF